MKVRRKNGLEDEGETFLILGIIGLVAYVGYKAYSSGAVQQAWQATTQATSGAFTPPGVINAPGGNFEIPGTGQSVSELLALGYTQAQIDQMLAEANATYGTPLVASMPQTTVDMTPWAGMASIFQ